MKWQHLTAVQKKLISITMIIIIIYTIINPLIYTKVYAVRDSSENNIENIDESLYPGYKALLKNLKATHPNWTFTLLYTNLEWTNVLDGETTHGHSLVQGKAGEWLCYDCAGIGYDGSSWVCASPVATAYYLDPRNFLTEDKIFQFESLSYVPSIHTEAGVEAILKGTFMSNVKMSEFYGKPEYGEKTFAQAIMYAAEVSKVSPYHIASRIKQEVNGPSPSVTGKVSGYEGLFNFCNIGATPTKNDENPSGDSVINGLIYARKEGWNNPETAIVGAAKWIGQYYISIGQDSLYLQKWDVTNAAGWGLYNHQYMTNIQAAASESISICSSYKKMFGDLSNTSFNFIIPMYKHIPQAISKYPSNDTSGVGEQMKVVLNIGVYLRSAPGVKLNSDKAYPFGTIVSRIEKATTKVDNYYWDKVVTPDGRVGYMARGTDNTAYLELLNPDPPTPPTPVEPTEKIKLYETEKIIKVIPSATLADIKEKYSDATLVSGTENLATGAIISINGVQYTVIKLGDVNGSGDVKNLDALMILKYYAGSYEFNNNQILAADIDGSGTVNNIDALATLKAYAGNYTVTIK